MTINTEAPRANRTLAIVIGLLALIAVGFLAVAGFITDRMWFSSMQHTDVFDRLVIVKIALFLVHFAIGLVFSFFSVRSALQARSALFQNIQISGVVDVARVERTIRRGAGLAVPALIGLMLGMGSLPSWSTWLGFLNRQPFGQSDEVFGKDISFYAFELPLYRQLQSTFMTLFVLTGLALLVLHYLTGGLRLRAPEIGQRPIVEISAVARRQVAIFGGLILLTSGVGMWLDRFSLVTGDNTLFTGITFVDANVHLPAMNMLSGISVLCALLFFANVVRSNWKLPLLGVGMFVLSSVLLLGIWPTFVQQVQVKPDEQAKEAPYISRNIAATRNAYGLDGVNYQSYDAASTPNQDVLDTDQQTLQNIRLMDPYVIARTVEQLQQLKGFYSFAPVMDVSRYQIDGKTRGTMLAVRELNLDGIPDTQRNWVTNHLIYTHGIGLVAAYDNTATADGEPEMFESDVPPAGSLGVKQPRIYFGENTTSYSIVGSANGIELDYPDDTASSGQQNTTYTGKGGVAIGGLLNKALFAARFSELNILLSEQVTEKARILYGRTPTERVQALAPWLTLDGDPYPAVVDGRILWIVDGYTTTDKFPYSQFSDFGQAVADSSGIAGVNERINYIRNSVKATVDAYDGTVTLYGWDAADPILKTWQAAFPGLITDKSKMSDALLSQIRYPEDLFKVQRDILRRYHISDPKAFFTGENFWIVPNDPTSSQALPQPPYYLNLQMPGAKSAAFTLTSTFAPAKRPSLAGFMAVNSDPGPDYGKITLLQLPSQTTVPGPEQAQNIFESDAAISSALSLLRRGGSDTVLGNLLSLPVGDGILYVQPVYVRAIGTSGYPLLRKVIVGFGQKVFMADTLSLALQQVLGTSVSPVDPGTPDPTLSAIQKLAKALAAAERAYADGQTALKNGDWSAYGAAQSRLTTAIKQAQAARAELEAKK